MQLLIKLLLLWALLLAAKVQSQEQFDFKYVDSLSYQLYQDHDWKKLIKISRLGFQSEIDYYYLRARAGIAYYESGKYLQAQKNFRKALEFNDLEEAMVEYLYYSSLFSGKPDQAKYLYHKYNRKNEEISAAQIKPVSEILFFSSYHFNTDNNPGARLKPTETPSFDGYQVVTNSILYNSLLLKHDLSPSLYFTHSLGLMNKNNYYLNSFQGILYESTGSMINQYQYYASMKFIPTDKFFINAGFHYLKYYSPDIVYTQINSTIKGIVPGFNENNYVGDLALFKSFWLIDAGAGITWSKLNKNQQFQQNYTLAFYPTGNLNLYLVSKVNLIKEEQPDENRENSVLLRQSLGFKAFKYLWVHGTLWHGEFKNASLNEGFYIFNGNESVHNKYDISMIVPLNKIKIGFIFSETSYFSSFYSNAGVQTGENKYSYNILTFSMSLKWNL